MSYYTQQDPQPLRDLVASRAVCATTRNKICLTERRHGRLAGVTTHMTPDEFRRYGCEVVDWIVDYYERIESFQ